MIFRMMPISIAASALLASGCYDNQVIADVGTDTVNEPLVVDCGDQVYSGNFEAYNNSELDELSGITHITGDLEFEGSITNLAALSELACIDGKLEAEETSLSSLQGLSSLARVDGELSITQNSNLSSLALNSLYTFEGSRVTVQSNASLPTCEATALVDRLTEHGWSGGVCISGNLLDDCEEDTSGCE